MVDLIESFDFTVFCSVKRHTGNAIDTEDESYENQVFGDHYDSNLSFDYPVVLEFSRLKQELHDLVAKIIMATIVDFGRS